MLMSVPPAEYAVLFQRCAPHMQYDLTFNTIHEGMLFVAILYPNIFYEDDNIFMRAPQSLERPAVSASPNIEIEEMEKR